MDKRVLDELCASACQATHTKYSLLFLCEDSSLRLLAHHGPAGLAEPEGIRIRKLIDTLQPAAGFSAARAPRPPATKREGDGDALGHWRAAPVTNAAGEVMGLLYVCADSPLTLTRNEEAELAASAIAIGQHLHVDRISAAAAREAFDILELIPLPAVLAEQHGVIRRANFAAEAFFGLRKAEFTGKDIVELVAGEPGRGEHRYCDITSSPLPQSGSTLFIHTFLDRTDRIIADLATEQIHQAQLHESHAEFHDYCAQAISKEIHPTLLIIGTLSKDRQHLDVLSSRVRGLPGDARRYDMAQLPCSSLLENREKMILDRLAARFPASSLITELRLQACVSLRLHSATGEPIGLICALFDRELSRRSAETCTQVLRNFAHAIAGRIKKAESSDIIVKLTSSVHHSPNAVVITDKNGIIEYANPRFHLITGYQEEECIGFSTRINSSGENHKSLYRTMWKQILRGEQWEGELLNRRKNGSLYWTRTKIFPLLNATGEITNFVSIQEDITQEKAVIEQLRHEASHDALTQLHNRAEFQKRLRGAIESARAEGSSHVLCFIDLDQFKMINDTCGHFAGDILLTQVSDIIKTRIRKTDTAARLGGDEFTIIMHDCPMSAATQTARAIHDRIAAMGFTWLGKTYSIGSCIGMTKIDGRIGDPDELLRQADYACYLGKSRGRNAIELFQRSNAQLLRKMNEAQWIPEITGAMKAGRLTLFCQAIAPLDSGDCGLDPQRYYYEVLIRMKSRGRRLISPASFLPAVERYGLSPKLDRYVVDTVFAFIDRHLADIQSLSSGLAINLSGSSLHDAQLLAFILKKLDAARLEKDRIRFEITETAAIANIQHARHFMESIRERGSLVCLDDFGSGLSSFGYLKNLPIDILKIDGELIKGISTDKSDFAIVKTINEMAHSLGYQTVGEYVENQDILDCLREIGVDCGQGYVIHRPAPLSSTLAARRNALLKT